MNTITNEATLIYAGIIDAEGGMFTTKLVKTFEDEASEAEWLAELADKVNNSPAEFLVSYSTKRI